MSYRENPIVEGLLHELETLSEDTNDLTVIKTLLLAIIEYQKERQGHEFWKRLYRIAHKLLNTPPKATVTVHRRIDATGNESSADVQKAIKKALTTPLSNSETVHRVHDI